MTYPDDPHETYRANPNEPLSEGPFKLEPGKGVTINRDGSVTAEGNEREGSLLIALDSGPEVAPWGEFWLARGAMEDEG